MYETHFPYIFSVFAVVDLTSELYFDLKSSFYSVLYNVSLAVTYNLKPMDGIPGQLGQDKNWYAKKLNFS
jgi:hypothetical protein